MQKDKKGRRMPRPHTPSRIRIIPVGHRTLTIKEDNAILPDSVSFVKENKFRRKDYKLMTDRLKELLAFLLFDLARHEQSPVLVSTAWMAAHPIGGADA